MEGRNWKSFFEGVREWNKINIIEIVAKECWKSQEIFLYAFSSSSTPPSYALTMICSEEKRKFISCWKKSIKEISQRCAELFFSPPPSPKYRLGEEWMLEFGMTTQRIFKFLNFQDFLVISGLIQFFLLNIPLVIPFPNSALKRKAKMFIEIYCRGFWNSPICKCAKRVGVRAYMGQFLFLLNWAPHILSFIYTISTLIVSHSLHTSSSDLFPCLDPKMEINWVVKSREIIELRFCRYSGLELTWQIISLFTHIYTKNSKNVLFIRPW